MRTSALLLLTILAASPTLARAQSSDLPTASEGEQRQLFAGIKNERAFANDAESAEIMEAAAARPIRYWIRGEYLIWFIKSPRVPTVITQGEFTDRPSPGALGAFGTMPQFGGLRYRGRDGARFTAGHWLDDEQLFGVEISYFFTAGRTISQSLSSPGNPVLAKPFFNVNTGRQDAALITYPGISSGSISGETQSFLQGAEANLDLNLWQTEHCKIEALAGFRWLNLNERVGLGSISVVDIAPQFAGQGLRFDGNTITVRDRFDALNHFYGGQLGGRVEWSRKRFTLGLTGKVALGVTHEMVRIRGATTIDTAPATNANAGVYALSSNSGRFSSSSFAVVPETGATLKFQITERLGLFGGYSFLYWSRVARPADQIDTNINPNLIPTSSTFGAGGPNQPAFRFRHGDFYAHGANFGLELRF